ncbi:MAG TPA: hypothetical protein VFR10_07530 [bacterium]|nr:hypothetical protein [bacterium]
MSTQHLENVGAKDPTEEYSPRMVFEPEPGSGSETSWDSLATLALDEAPLRRTPLARALAFLRKPTVLLSIAVLALAYPAYKGMTTKTRPLPNFPGRDNPEAQVAASTTIVLTPSADASKAEDVTIRESKPVLEIVLVGPDDLDPAKKWKVAVQHPGREIWQSKWARQFQMIKGEPRLKFELDGRSLPEGPLTIVLKEAKPKGVEGGQQEIYRLRVKRR